MSDFNINALGAFRCVNFGNADAIANLDGKGGVEQNGELGNFIGKMFRSGATEAANNAVRTELLRALGNAFGISGMTESKGKVSFSADFMAKLERILGRDVLKTDDFEIGRNGTDIEPLKKYIAQTIQLFAQKMVDVYLECKAEGRMDAFRAHCEEPGACMEEKGLKLTKFQEKLFAPPVEEGKGLSPAEVVELERIANQAVGDNAPPDKSEDLVYGVIDALNKSDEKLNASENWADFSAAAKGKLLGKTAKIVVPVKNAETGFYDFKPLVVNGKEVVRPLTEEDIDTIGKACLYNTVNV